MTDNKNDNPDENKSSSERPGGFAFDGDLGFASDDDARILKNTDDAEIDDNSEEFIPADKPTIEDTGFLVNAKDAEDSDASKPKEGLRAADTWVPELNQAAPEPDDPMKTWVPSDTPTASGIDAQHVAHETDNEEAESIDDPNRTWVPSSTPTFNGVDQSAELDDSDLTNSETPEDDISVDKTWVPSSTPTVDGISDVDTDVDDPNKTYVPSSSPTFDGMGGAEDSDEPSIEDVDKTWVPSKTPTHHEFSFDGEQAPGDSEGDPNKTWVPSDTPTADGLSLPVEDDDPDGMKKTAVIPAPESEPQKTGSGTVVMDQRDSDSSDPSDSTTAGTVVCDMPVAVEKTVFSQTMGARGGTQGEDEWLKEVEENTVNDTDIFELPEEMVPSKDSRSTQIWSHQSVGGLDASLTIRKAPVAGETTFEDSLKTDQPDYQIIKKLAEGGMGAIYIAKQTSLGRELAIKTLKPLRANEKKTYQAQGRMSQVQKQRREMFLSEALVTGNLVHPHIIPIHDLCQAGDDAPFYSMKRVHGTPWNESIQSMSLEENLDVLHKVCDAMAYAHHNGVVNRDLKPENVMLGEFGEVLVLDWGLAVPATKGDKSQFASPAAPFGAGTPAYMSPELWTGPAEAIGVWSDIYLLGAILFEAITGESPHEFPEPDSKAGNTGLWMVIDKVVRKNTIRESEHAGELMDIAMKAMSSSPKKRHLTVLEFQEAIKEFQKHEESRYLTERADQSLAAGKSGKQQQGYQNYQTAAALYEEAHVAWPDNHAARTGLRNTRLHYAGLAHTKGDYDLGLQVASQEDDSDFVELAKKLTRSKFLRSSLKTAMVIATLLVLCVGTYSFIQRNEIIALVGTKESLESQVVDAQDKLEIATVKAAEADTKVAAADAKVEAAEGQLLAANDALATAQHQVDEVESDLKEAEDKFEAAEDKLNSANTMLVAANAKVEEADGKLDTATIKLTEANKKIASTNLELADLEVQKKRLSEEKIRAGVDLDNAKIASRIKNADYAAALRNVEELLASFEMDPELAKLPKNEREERIVELKAQQRQLRKRTTQTEAPVQTQLISPSGQTVVQGDDQGNLFVWKLDKDSEQLPQTPFASQAMGSVVSSIRMSKDEQLVVAASGRGLNFWNVQSNKFETKTEHDSPITTLRMKGDYLLTADDSGKIQGWDIENRKPLWSIKSSSSIRDLELLADSSVFLYAGSRGGQSADILAYKLPPDSDPSARPVRMGQLRLPRDRNNPPRRIAVSPDESLLIISNSRNGDLMVLPKVTSDDAATDKFPFVHAAELQKEGLTNWIASRHQRPVNDIVFSQDGARVATASDDRTIGVWELPTGGGLQLLERLEGHGARVNSVGFLDAGGRRVLSASADRYCRFWNVDNYDQEKNEIERAFKIDSIDAGFLKKQAWPSISDSENRPQRADRHSQTNPQKSNWIAVRYESASDEANVDTTARDVPPVVINANGEIQRGALSTIVLSKDGSRVVTGAADGTAVIWDASSGRQIKGISTRARYNSESGSFDEGHEFNVARLRFLPPSGNVLMTTGFDGTLCLWNADTENSGAGRQELRIPGLGLVNAIATSQDGDLIVTSGGGDELQRVGSAMIWITDTLLKESNSSPVAVLSGYHRSEVSAIAVSTDGQKVATGARDGRLAIWETSTGNLIAGGQIHAKNTIVSHLQWLPDDSLLSAGFDGRLAISEWDPLASKTKSSESARLSIRHQFAHDRIPVERLALAPGQDRFVTISVRTDKQTNAIDYELELWNLNSDKRVRRIKPAVVGGKTPDRIVAISWSHNADRMVAVVDDNLHVFDSNNWKVTNVLDAPGLGISDVVFAPENMDHPNSANIIATFDGTASHLWNIEDRSHIADFRPLFAVKSAALVEHGDTNLLLTGDRAVRIFQADESSEDFGQTVNKISDPHGGVVTAIQFSPNGTATIHPFVSSGADGSAALWNWNQQAGEASFVRWLKQDATPIVSVCWNNDATQILVAEKAGALHVFSADNAEVTSEFMVQKNSNVELASAVFSDDSRFLAVAGQVSQSGESSGWVFQVDAAELPKLHCTISGGHEAGGIRDIRFLPGSSYLVTGGADGAALIWNWQPGRVGQGVLAAYEAFQLLADGKSQAHQAPINAIDVSSGTTIATACEDGTAVVWQNPFAQ